MKKIAKMSAEELAGLVCQKLQDSGVTVTLTGGACVAIWSEGKYVSHDLDFIEEGPVPRRMIRDVLGRLGFNELGRHFFHPDTKFIVEFPNGPLTVGDQRIEKVSERRGRKTGEKNADAREITTRDPEASYTPKRGQNHFCCERRIAD